MSLPLFPSASARPRIPGGLARRIDRLSRRAHAFHRFAHHPLCDRYAPEVVALGRKTRVCRGCLAAVSGGGLGIAVGLSLRGHAVPPGWLVAAALLCLPAFFLRRGGKTFRRFLPAFGLGCLASAGAWLGLVTALVLGGLLLAAYRRRGPSRVPCETCPERRLEVCSGFQPIVARERALQRRVRPWLSPPPARLGGAIDTLVIRPL